MSDPGPPSDPIAAEDDSHRSDSALVRACLDGDQAAWTTLVERYSRLVSSVARRSGLTEADADDVVQLVFTTLFQRLPALRDQSRLSAWLITTAYRESWRLARGHRPHDDPDDAATQIADAGAPPPELVVQAERDQLVRDALARLDDRCRVLLTALFLEAGAPSYEAIGQRLGVPTGSIGPTRARCFKKLEAILADLGLDNAE